MSVLSTERNYCMNHAMRAVAPFTARRPINKRICIGNNRWKAGARWSACLHKKVQPSLKMQNANAHLSSTMLVYEAGLTHGDSSVICMERIQISISLRRRRFFFFFSKEKKNRISFPGPAPESKMRSGSSSRPLPHSPTHKPATVEDVCREKESERVRTSV